MRGWPLGVGLLLPARRYRPSRWLDRMLAFRPRPGQTFSIVTIVHGTTTSATGHDTVGEVARGLVLEDQLVAPIGQDLALDDGLALEGLGCRGDPSGRTAAPFELHGLPGAGPGRPVARVHHRVHDIAVVERLARRRAVL